MDLLEPRLRIFQDCIAHKKVKKRLSDEALDSLSRLSSQWVANGGAFACAMFIFQCFSAVFHYDGRKELSVWRQWRCLTVLPDSTAFLLGNGQKLSTRGSFHRQKTPLELSCQMLMLLPRWTGCIIVLDGGRKIKNWWCLMKNEKRSERLLLEAALSAERALPNQHQVLRWNREECYFLMNLPDKTKTHGILTRLREEQSCPHLIPSHHRA